MVTNLLDELKHPDVRDALEMLSGHGLGVTVLHSHHGSSDAMSPLDSGTVQFEDDLRVSFVDAFDPVLDGSVAVTAAWVDGPVVVGRCRQGHDGGAPAS